MCVREIGFEGVYGGEGAGGGGGGGGGRVFENVMNMGYMDTHTPGACRCVVSCNDEKQQQRRGATYRDDGNSTSLLVGRGSFEF